MDPRDYYCKTSLPAPKVEWESVWGDSLPATPKTLPWKRGTMGSSKDLWDAEIVERLRKVGLIPATLRVFKWAEGRCHTWHIDGNSYNVTPCAINWVMTGGGTIQWDPDRKINWVMDQNGAVRDLDKDLSRDTSLESNPDDYFVCETAGTAHQCLVKTNIPHRVVNLGQGHRTTISMVFHKPDKWSYEHTRDTLGEIGFLE